MQRIMFRFHGLARRRILHIPAVKRTESIKTYNCNNCGEHPSSKSERPHSCGGTNSTEEGYCGMVNLASQLSTQETMIIGTR